MTIDVAYCYLCDRDTCHGLLDEWMEGPMESAQEWECQECGCREVIYEQHDEEHYA